jgi:hypothetical protein
VTSRRSRRPWSRRAPRLIAAGAGFAICVGAAFGAGLTVASDDEPPLFAEGAAGPGFLPAPGWNLLNTGLTVPPQAPFALAANVPPSERDRSTGGRPDETIRSLGATGVVLYALFIPAGHVPSIDATFPERELPLRLTDARENSPQGPQPPGQTLRLLARIGGFDIDVTIYFGADEPSAAVRATAAEQLARLVVPGCPQGSLAVNGGDRAAAAAYARQWLSAHYLGQLTDLAGAKVDAFVVGVDDAPHGGAVTDECPDVARRMIEVRVTLPEKAQQTVDRLPLSYLVIRTQDGWTIWRHV